jgi:hypothetical protein
MTETNLNRCREKERGVRTERGGGRREGEREWERKRDSAGDPIFGLPLVKSFFKLDFILTPVYPTLTPIL